MLCYHYDKKNTSDMQTKESDQDLDPQKIKSTEA